MNRLIWLAGLAGLAASGLIAGSGPAEAGSARPDALPRHVEWTQVDAVSGHDVWVGGTSITRYAAISNATSYGNYTIFAHWNGRSWSVIPAPPGSLRNAAPVLMAASSAANLWATWSNASRTIEHWNGKSWKSTRVPAGAYLNALAVISPHDAWAAGQSVTEESVLLHWTGKAWQRVPSPDPGGYGVPTALDMRTARSGWAAGFDGNGAMVLRWNGTAWSAVAVPGAAQHSILSAADASTAGSAWAAGQTDESNKTSRSMILHWNGQSWVQVRAPSYSMGCTGYEEFPEQMMSVAAISARAAWASGFYCAKAPSTAAPALLHWNGKRWSKAALPGDLGATELSGVGANDVWAAGETESGVNWTILRWNGSKWKKVLVYHYPKVP